MFKRLLLLILSLCVISTSALPGGVSRRRSSRTSPKANREMTRTTLESRVRHTLERRMWETPKSSVFQNREIVRRPLITRLRVNLDTIGAAKRLARFNAIEEAKSKKHQASHLSGNLAKDSITLMLAVPGLMPPSHSSSGSKGVSINGDENPK